MKETKNTVKILFSIGGILIITIAMTLLIVTLGFFIGLSVSKWQFPAGFILASALYFFIAKAYYGNITTFVKSLLSCSAVIILSTIIALNFYDASFDGQSYHMEEIYQLKNGWNPTKKKLPASVNMALYINHYSKGVEIPQSTLYSLTERIESGKATNFMLIIAALCLTLALLLSSGKLSLLKCIFISVFAALNPIAVNQLLSTYVDGQLAIMLLCFFVVSTWTVRMRSNFSFLVLGAIIILTANIKFTGLVYIVLFSFAYLAWLALVNYQKIFFRKAFLITLTSGMVAVLFIGYSTYVLNTLDYKHPFYPLMGENKVDIMQHNLPPGFGDHNDAGKFFVSLFGHSDNPMASNGRQIALKLPFTINKNDIVNSYAIDTRIAGFGAMFSGIILLSIALIIILLVRHPERWKYKKNWLYILGLVIVSVVIMPESWWARYVPQFWYFPIIVLLISELYIGDKFKKIKLLMYICLCINVSFSLLSFRYNFIMTNRITKQMEKIKDFHQTIAVQWNISGSNRIRFQENDIPYTEQDLRNKANTEHIICSEAMFLLPSAKTISSNTK
ncbi:MAG: hypothetical protein ABWY16_15370 [Pedobacter sp.]|uniref:hypothetical protein n=1 Tax=Pedobacter sp. TaxID=1411316 RepID=UPI0033990726